MDIVAVSSLVIALSTAIGYIIHQLHLRNCECLCIKSDCTKQVNEPPTPPFVPVLETLLAPVPATTETEKSPLVKRKVNFTEITL
jgi:hypothetical protein